MNTQLVDTSLLRDGLMEFLIEGMKGTISTYQNIIGSTISTRQQYEQTAHSSGLGLLRRIDENEKTPLMTDVQRGTKTYTPVEWGGRIRWNRRMKNHDIYGYTAKMGQQLGQSIIETQNLIAARTLANGASQGANPTTPWDGAPVFGSHTTSRGSTYSNRFTLAASSTAVHTVLSSIASAPTDVDTPRRFPDGFKLICGPAMVPAFTSILYAQGGVAGTTDHGSNSYISTKIKTLVEESWFTTALLGFASSWFILPTSDTLNPFFKLLVQEFDTSVAPDPNYRAYDLSGYGEFVIDAKGHHGTAASIV